MAAGQHILGNPPVHCHTPPALPPDVHAASVLAAHDTQVSETASRHSENAESLCCAGPEGAAARAVSRCGAAVCWCWPTIDLAGGGVPEAG